MPKKIAPRTDWRPTDAPLSEGLEISEEGWRCLRSALAKAGRADDVSTASDVDLIAFLDDCARVYRFRQQYSNAPSSAEQRASVVGVRDAARALAAAIATNELDPLAAELLADYVGEGKLSALNATPSLSKRALGRQRLRQLGAAARLVAESAAGAAEGLQSTPGKPVDIALRELVERLTRRYQQETGKKPTRTANRGGVPDFVRAVLAAIDPSVTAGEIDTALKAAIATLSAERQKGTNAQAISAPKSGAKSPR